MSDSDCHRHETEDDDNGQDRHDEVQLPELEPGQFENFFTDMLKKRLRKHFRKEKGLELVEMFLL